MATRLIGPRNGQWRPALERFAEKCRFDATTGCVLWIGATSAGQGNTTRYGSFWDQGRSIRAHRWAAVHIHGIDLGSDEAGHCCPHGHNSLCVQHVEGQTKSDNVGERNTRVAKANQSAATRQFYLFKQLGIYEPEPEIEALVGQLHAVPFYSAPDWFRPFMNIEESSDDCPF